MDPFQGLASFVLGKMKQSAMALYLKAIFTMIASGVISFLFTCGTSLVSTRVWSVSIGTGMVVASIVMVVAFKQSDIAKKLSIVIPELESEQMKAEGTTIIQK